MGAIAVFLSTANTFHIARYNIGDQNALIPVQFLAVTFAVLKRSPLAYLALACMSGRYGDRGFFSICYRDYCSCNGVCGGFSIYPLNYFQTRNQSIVFLGIVSATLVGVYFRNSVLATNRRAFANCLSQECSVRRCLYPTNLQFGRIFLSCTVWQYARTRTRCLRRLVGTCLQPAARAS